MKPLIFLSWEC